MQLDPGVRLGRYRIIASLGSGGMGEVFCAQDTALEREVALKVLPEAAIDHVGPERFEREARAVAALNHPNILTIHDFGASEGVAFAVMELLDGESLRDRLLRDPIHWREALRITHQVAAGLAAAHDKGIVHRDIKPGNIHLTSAGEVKVLDFGIARFHDLQRESTSSENSRTRSGAVLGTAAYMSPEQARGHRVDGRSDLFSLGCVLYEMLTGEKPFRRKTLSATLLAITSEAAPPIDDPEIPPGVKDLVALCLTRSRERRIGTASELQTAIDMILDGGRYTPAWTARRPRTRSVALATVATLVVLALATTILVQDHRAKQQPHRLQSLAVLPLADLSPESTSYFADGMTEALIAELGRTATLRVISRTSVMQFRNSRLPIHEIADELGVDAVVEGSVTRFRGRVRVIARLVEASDGEQVWTRTFENELRDILTLQREIATAIARQVRSTMAPSQLNRLQEVAQVDPAVHEAYLRGRYELNQLTANGTRSAIDWFGEAVLRDPAYAPGFAGLAEAYLQDGRFQVRPAHESYERARAAAQRALELEPESSDALASLGIIRSEFDWDWPAARYDLGRALTLNPGDARVHERMAVLLAALGRFEQAVDHARRAQELDPLSPMRRTILARVLYFAGRPEQCVSECRTVLGLDPGSGIALGYLHLCLEQTGQYDEAIRVGRQANVELGLDPDRSFELGHTCAVSGRLDEARRVMERLQGGDAHVNNVDLAILHAGLGEPEQAVRRLEQARLERESWLRFVAVDPRLRPLHDRPDYRALLSRLGLTVVDGGDGGPHPAGSRD